MTCNLNEQSMELHRKLKGKLAVVGKAKIKSMNDLSLLYTPGVAEPCREIAKNKNEVYELTGKGNNVAIVTDGTRVLGLGNIGAEAALPVMEGKALIMQQFGKINAIPICLATKNAEEIVAVVKALEPNFGAINLEDIETPKVFEIEEILTNELSIPVFHDDQHGTAMVVLAGLINALKIAGKTRKEVTVAIVGAGSAGYAITKLLSAYGFYDIVVFDSHGAIVDERADLEEYKKKIALITTKKKYDGLLKDFAGADAVISAAAPGALPEETIMKMKEPKIVFALANPNPELTVEEAEKWGVKIFGTGRSDLPNQINNSICFPGFLRALLDLRVRKITDEMKIAASEAIASCVSRKERAAGKIVPDVFNRKVVKKIGKYVKKAVGNKHV
jgi:malate dehydrogenase (oxaloacetate-decarboxylating)